jgi:hypothetical protein
MDKLPTYLRQYNAIFNQCCDPRVVAKRARQMAEKLFSSSDEGDDGESVASEGQLNVILEKALTTIMWESHIIESTSQRKLMYWHMSSLQQWTTTISKTNQVRAPIPFDKQRLQPRRCKISPITWTSTHLNYCTTGLDAHQLEDWSKLIDSSWLRARDWDDTTKRRNPTTRSTDIKTFCAVSVLGQK